MNKQRTYKVNQPVFVHKYKKRGVIQSFEDGKIVVKFGENTEFFSPKEISPYRPKKRRYKTHFQMTTEFHKAFNCPAPDKPTILTEQQVINRASWIAEEVIELLYASSRDNEHFAQMYLTLCENMGKTYSKQLEKERDEDVLTAQADAFVDILYFGNGGFTELGIDPNPLFNIVHAANMAKLWDDGKPHYNEVGKVVKPPNWQAPEPKLKREIERQKNRK
jgi:predicted HAD superfamily Cof-like phosphohydrolase